MTPMRTLRIGLMMVTALTAGACVTAPTGPSTLLLPGEGKTHDQFRADDARCRPLAVAEVQATPGGYVTQQAKYDMAYVQCMYSAGHQVPVRGAPVRSSDAPPSTPSATPAPAPPTR
jgi:hypothetical protein